MKSNVLTNVLLGVLIVLVIVCTAVLQQEMQKSRSVIEQLLDKQLAMTVPGATQRAGTIPGAVPGARTIRGTVPGTGAVPGAGVEEAVPQTTRRVPAVASLAAQQQPATRTATPKASSPKATTTQTPKVQASEKETPHLPVSGHGKSAKAVASTAPTPPAPPAPVAPKQTAAEKIQQQNWARYGKQVTKIIRDLLDGRYDAVVKQFNGDMKEALPKTSLAMVMDMARQSHGSLDHVASHAPMNAPLPANMHAFVVTAATQKGLPLVFTITLDDKGKIAGLYLR